MRLAHALTWMKAGLAVLMVVWSVITVAAADKPAEKPANPSAKTVEQIAEACRPSVVVITHSGRDGKQHGLGTGFVVGADGLIATNYHVIGEARPIQVKLASGKKYDVTSILASDRSLDLAIVKIDAKDLKPLELGDSTTLKDGQPVVALGNPLGLTHSVVSGVVSGKRELDGRHMIQVAMPIESGNSGGPLVDMQGRVHGLITMKSLVTANLGFAVSINSLKPLLKKPNPIPMSRWLTIGMIDAKEWKVQGGANWRQRAGKIQVEGLGAGFGGRSLCLSQRKLPAAPFEMAVTVRLDDEGGAAGLAFHADGGDKHYGFYPSSGELRLTRFEGPDVYSWKILHKEPSKHYKPGEWNTIKVRVEKDRLKCYVNDQMVVESTDAALTEGKVGLAKFRDTKAEFKNFKIAKEINAATVSPELARKMEKSIADLPPDAGFRPEVIEPLVPNAQAGAALLRAKAKQLEQHAANLRQLAQVVHQKSVEADLAKALQAKEDDIDLLQAALLIARLDNDELDIEVYRQEVGRMAKEISDGLAKDADEKKKLEGLATYLFKENGFHGSRGDYYNRSNSYLNEVIDDREGLPITLSVLYMDLARRLGVKVVGVSFPGHFIVRHEPAKGEPQLIDVYEGGTALSKDDAAKQVQATLGRPLQDADLTVANKRAIVVRMLHNLVNNARREKDGPSMIRYLDVVLAVTPEAGEERWLRAMLRFNAGNKKGALEDVDWLLDHPPDGVDLDEVRALRKALERSSSK